MFQPDKSKDDFSIWRLCPIHIAGNDCPYCRIAELDRIAKAAEVWANTPLSVDRDTKWAIGQAIVSALRAAGYLKD